MPILIALGAAWKPIGALLDKIPWQIWAALAIALAAFLLVHDRNHWKAVATERQAELVNYRRQDDAAKAKAAEADKQIATLTAQLRKASDAQNAAIATDAGTLRVSGPGKSRCPSVPSAPSGHVQSPAKPDVAGPSLPATDGNDLSAVPWDWLVTRAQEHDQLLNEVEAWRNWHDQVLKLWPKK